MFFFFIARGKSYAEFSAVGNKDSLQLTTPLRFLNSHKMRIAISAIFFYNPGVCRAFLNNISVGIRQHLSEFAEDSITLIITNNAPTETIDKTFHPFLAAENARLEIRILNNTWNKGYGLAHNEAFLLSESDTFIILNNDLTFQTRDWISTFCSVIEDGNAIAGLQNAPNSLNQGGEGYVSSNEEFDYAEGSALAINSAIAEQHGLFAADIKTAYYEDSDLSLRYRQLGYRIRLLNIAHTHLRGISTENFPAATLKSIRERNKSRFISRWSNYLEKRSFAKRNLIILDCIGLGDVICALPAVIQLCNTSPYIDFDLALELKHLSFLFDNIKNLRVISTTSLASDAVLKHQYDRIAKFSDTRCTSTNYLGREIAATMGVEFFPELGSGQIVRLGGQNDNFALPSETRSSDYLVIVHIEYLREEFEGRGLTAETCGTIFKELRQQGFTIVNIGTDPNFLKSIDCADLVHTDLAGKISIRELAGLIGSAKLFVGIDSGPLHIAQFLNIPTFAVFGATSPIARILNWENSTVYMEWNLECLGCYHLSANSFVPNRCIRIDQACVKRISVSKLTEHLRAFLLAKASSLPSALKLSQSIDALLKERELRSGSAIRINELERTLARYESGGSLLTAATKRLIKRIPGARRAYVWLRSRKN